LIDDQRLYVPVEVDGKPGLFFIDTGSGLTFLNLGPDDPSFEKDAALLTIGCETISIPARGGVQSLGVAFGQPVLGFLGVDYLIESTSLLDMPGERVVRPAPQSAIEEANQWSVLPYDNVQGMVIAPVLLDNTPVRLMLDTGAFHTVWLGQQGEPGDQEIEVSDAKGNPLSFFLGEVDLEMAARDVVTVPVLRAPSFPTEQTVADLGGNIHGLPGSHRSASARCHRTATRTKCGSGQCRAERLPRRPAARMRRRGHTDSVAPMPSIGAVFRRCAPRGESRRLLDGVDRRAPLLRNEHEA
jgi:hypothetical protein